MASQKIVQAVLVFLVSTAIFYVVDATFGVAMGQMRTSFTTIAASLTLSAGWHNVLTGILAGWSHFFDAFAIIIIAIGVWVVKTIIIKTDYNKPGM